MSVFVNDLLNWVICEKIQDQGQTYIPLQFLFITSKLWIIRRFTAERASTPTILHGLTRFSYKESVKPKLEHSLLETQEMCVDWILGMSIVYTGGNFLCHTQQVQSNEALHQVTDIKLICFREMFLKQQADILETFFQIFWYIQ